VSSLAGARKRVLVTGGAGFIGSHVVDRLVEAGYGVCVLDNLSTGRLENIRRHLGGGGVEFVRGDVRDVKAVKRGVCGCDAVVHLAALTSVPLSVKDPDLTFAVNVGGTMNLLSSCSRQSVGKFVFVSSCAVYGEPVFLPITERHPTNPISPYAESKLAGEKYALGFDEREILRSVVLRFFNVYGVRQVLNDYCGVIARFISRARQGLPLVVYGGGDQTRDFVNVVDVAAAVVESLESRDADGEVFNVGFGEATSIDDLAIAVLDLTGSNVEVIHDEPRVGDIVNSYANISKAEKLLGYKPTISLRDGLRTLLAEKEVASQ
jgi:UDP-glucose 4-epimerase